MFLKLPNKTVEFPYENEYWRIEFRKENYIICQGCEIGVYKRTHFYKKLFWGVPADEMLRMSLRLDADGRQIAVRPSVKSWWLTAFRLKLFPFVRPNALTLTADIIFPDNDMYTAFSDAFHTLRDTEIKILQSDMVAHQIRLQW